MVVRLSYIYPIIFNYLKLTTFLKKAKKKDVLRNLEYMYYIPLK